MVEMTPEREAEIRRSIEFHRRYFTCTGEDCEWYSCAGVAELLAALRAERERAEKAERETEEFQRKGESLCSWIGVLLTSLSVSTPEDGVAKVEALTRERDELAVEIKLKVATPLQLQAEEITRLRACVADLTREVERLRSEVWTTHVPVTGTQHDPSRGLIHGCCERCRMPWPCDYSPERALTPLELCQDRLERIRRAREEMRAPKDVDAAAIATNAADAALTPLRRKVK